jgi:hypothetical protein
MMAKTDSEWDQRVLCSDGNCIGVVGADGRCKECGAPYDGDLTLPADQAPAVDEDMDGSPGDQPMTEEGVPADEDSPVGSDGPDGSWESRTLCADESCIGVIGPDGRCKECGKPHPG